MASGKIELSKLKGWIDLYKTSVGNSRETVNCLLSLEQLRSLMTYIDNQNVNLTAREKIDGVRIYFIREKPPHLESLPVTLSTGEKADQMSIAIVPTHGYSMFSGNAGAYDYKEGNSIYAVMPGGENSGLCPPNCGGGQ